MESLERILCPGPEQPAHVGKRVPSTDRFYGFQLSFFGSCSWENPKRLLTRGNKLLGYQRAYHDVSPCTALGNISFLLLLLFSSQQLHQKVSPSQDQDALCKHLEKVYPKHEVSTCVAQGHAHQHTQGLISLCKRGESPGTPRRGTVIKARPPHLPRRFGAEFDQQQEKHACGYLCSKFRNHPMTWLFSSTK